MMVLVPLLQLLFLAVDTTDAYLIRTEDGATEVFALPDEQAVRLLFWVQEPDTQLNLTYIVMSFQYPTLNLTISQTEEWISAHFYHDRVYIPVAGVEKFPTPASWWGRKVSVSSWEPAYWYLCRSPYECCKYTFTTGKVWPRTRHNGAPGPPPWGTHQAVGTSTATVSRDSSPTVVILGVVCGVLFLTVLVLCVYICYVRRTNTLQDARDQHIQCQEVAQVSTHGSASQVPPGLAVATVLHTTEGSQDRVRTCTILLCRPDQSETSSLVRRTVGRTVSLYEDSPSSSEHLTLICGRLVFSISSMGKLGIMQPGVLTRVLDFPWTEERQDSLDRGTGTGTSTHPASAPDSSRCILCVWGGEGLAVNVSDITLTVDAMCATGGKVSISTCESSDSVQQKDERLVSFWPLFS